MGEVPMHKHMKTFQEAPVEVPENLEPVYANHVLVRYSSTRFLLDFAQVLPGVRTHRVRTRISLTPHDTLMLSEALSEQWSPLVADDLGYDAWPGHRLPGPVNNGKSFGAQSQSSFGDLSRGAEHGDGRADEWPAKAQLLHADRIAHGRL